MKLRSLALNQVKKFTAPVHLDGIGDGLNVIVGPNEMGKSTLLDALRAVLFEKHGSKAKPIAALQNDRNQAGPVVTLVLELDDGLYRVTKRFLKKPYARLHCPDGRILEGDAAEEALRERLGFAEAGKQGAKPETIGMWNVLWVQQGQSFGAPEIPETARSSLHAALESEVGTALGGRRGRLLPQEIDRQHGALVTGNGKPRGQYKELLDHLESLESALTELSTRRQELSRTLDDLEVAEDTLQRLSPGESDRADEAELKAARARRGELAELEARIKAAATGRTLQERDVESANQALADRRKLKAEIASNEESEQNARTRLAEVTNEENELRAQLEALRAEVGNAESAVAEADAAVLLGRRILAAGEHAARIEALQAQCAKAEAAERREHEARQSAAAILVSDETIKQVRAAAASLESANARLDAAATTITFEMSPDAVPGIEIDGKPLTPDRRVIRAVAPATITIAGRGRIFIDPAMKDRDALLARRRSVGARLKETLEAAGTATAQDADDQHAARKKLLEQADLALQEAALYAPATADYEAGARPLADHIEGLRQLIVREKGELGVPELPATEDAEAALRAAEHHAHEARAELATTRARLAEPEAVLARSQTELGATTARFEEAARRLETLREQHAQSERAHPDSQLLLDIEAAGAALATQTGFLEGLEAQRVGETLAQLDEHVARLERAIQLRSEKRANLRETIARLQSHVEASDGAGLDEAIARKCREIELFERERDYLQREVKVLSLLLSTLRAAEGDAKERYLAPVLRRVRPYLQFLFPGAEIVIDEDLQITGIVREPDHEETFHRLSMGTQEQIAVLARLALAEMLVEQGQPATVILDDALVFSDDRRMSRMFDVLNTAARKVQIIIFTCREQLFEGLGGRQLSLAPGSEEDLMSA